MARSVDEIRAELAVAELEQQLRDAKNTDDGPGTDLKHELRAARQAYRELRGSRPAGSGDARPDTIAATATVEETN